MAGVRLGFVVGNAKIIKALQTIKSNIDYGTFRPLLNAGVEALINSTDAIIKNRETYQRRRDIWVDGCALAGWNIKKPKASMFVWAPVPTEQDSLSFVMDLARETGVILVPGSAFGEFGEGYVRVGLVKNEDMLRQAVEKVKTFLENKD